MRHYSVSFSPRRLKPVAWLCMSLQVFSACSVSLASIALAAQTPTSRTTINASELMGLPAKPYVLRQGETPASVATSLGLTTAQLKSFNQLRTFKRPFAQLRGGDEIDIPDVSRLNSQGGMAVNAPDNSSSPDANAARLAAGAQATGSLLGSQHGSGAAAGMASSMASGAASDAVQKWLNHFGTAQANISVDEHGSLDNSSLDWLVPLYDSPQNMLFTQFGARNKDSRNTVNLGWGVRWLTPGWMFGFNNFFDNDLTGNNRRAGLGAEARTDYLSLAGNTYFGLSGWHQSRDFSDYDERPANGFDVRADGWLPAYPQLGGKLVYEQYYGDEVALFGKDNRQHNPYAVTAGVNWTPFPLLTVGVDERMGKGGQNETNMNLQVTWRPGDSLESQLSPESVGATHLLQQSRYDLVDRNNDIVLEYRKQEVLDLTLSPYTVTGPSGSSQPLSASVKSRYTVRNVNLDSASFLAAGGSVAPQGMTHFILTLPLYRNAPQGSNAATLKALNTYNLTAVAEDEKGNLSQPRTVTVVVLPPQLNIGSLAGGDAQPADGNSAIGVNTTVTDGNGHPVAGQEVTWKITYADGSTKTLTGVSDANGNISQDITSTVAGPATVEITTGDQTKSTSITFTPVTADTGHSSLVVSPPGIVADGIDASTITLTLKDKDGHPVTGQKIDLSSSLAGTTLSNIRDNGDGTYTATLTGTATGIADITVSVNGAPFAVPAASITLGAITPDSRTASLTNSGAGLTTVSDNAIANGIATDSVKAIVTDAHGLPVADQVVSFSANNGANIIATGTTDANGSVTVTLSSLKAGTSTVTASLNGSTATTPAQFVANNGTASLTNSGAGLSIVADNAVANGTATDSVKAIVTDANGNPVSGQVVSFSANNGATIVVSGTTGVDGSVTITLTSLTAGTSTVTASLNGSSATTAARFVANSGSASLTNSGAGLSTVADNAIANGIATDSVKAIATDASGNPVSGQIVSFSADNGATVVATGTTGLDGSVTVTLTSLKAGTSIVTASLNGSTATTPAQFVANTGTASLTNSGAGLSTVADNAIANGTATDSVKAIVTDTNGNPVSGQVVNFSANNGATILATGTTGVDGSVTVTLTSLKAGTSTVTASLNGSTATTPVQFVANSGSASLTNSGAGLSTVADNAIANGTATDSVKAVVTDTNGNPVSGQVVSFSANNGATILATGTTGADGSVTVTLTSLKAGSSTVTASLNGSTATTPAQFVAGAADAGQSSLTASPNTIVADGTAASTITLTLKDVNGNPVTGQSVTFNSSLGGTNISNVTDAGNGVWTAKLTGNSEGSTSITANVGGSAFGVSAATVTLQPAVSPLLGSLSVNGQTYGINSGFPTTGFKNAKFQILKDNSAANNSDFNWSADQSWVAVDTSGNVTFTGTADSSTKTVTITAAPKAGGTRFTWSFTVNSWYINNGSTLGTWNQAQNYCTSKGYTAPSIAQMTNEIYNGSGSSRAASNSAVWSEWGNMASFFSAGFVANGYWAAQVGPSGNHFRVGVTDGHIVDDNLGEGHHTICRLGL